LKESSAPACVGESNISSTADSDRKLRVTFWIFLAAGTLFTLANLGNVYQQLGRWPNALAHHREALIICRETGHRHLETDVLNSLGESCYEGVRLLTELMRRAGSVEVGSLTSVSEGLAYESPRGTVELCDRHLRQRVFLAVADGLVWDVIQEL